jgi:hypothetical protein
MNVRACLLALALAAPLALATVDTRTGFGVRGAEASVSVPVTLAELVASSSYVVVGVAKDHYSVWEELPHGKRIVTYTKIKVDKAVVGAPGTELWVRTLGGAVGEIGQSVAGEAQLAIGERALVFVTKIDSTNVVTARAQGHFPLLEVGKAPAKLAPSPDIGMLLPKQGPVAPPASSQLVGAVLDDAIKIITQAASQKATDGKK